MDNYLSEFSELEIKKVGYNYLSKKHNNKLILNTNKVS